MNNFYKKYGPWALVTGASSGIGEAFARQLAALNFNLVLIARRQEKLLRLAGELTSQHGIEVQALAIDVSADDFLHQLELATNTLEIGLLINSAGFALTGNFLDHTMADEVSLLHVNCRAPLMLTHAFGQKMRQRGRGGIIHISSASAFLPMPGWTNYSASKVYNLHLAEGLWHELKENGIDVLALCPGATRTEFSTVAGTKQGGMAPAQVAQAGLQNLGKKPTVVAGLGNRIVTCITRFIPRRCLIEIGAKTMRKFII